MISFFVYFTAFLLILFMGIFLTNSIAEAMEEEQAFRNFIYAALCFLAVIITLTLYGVYCNHKPSALNPEGDQYEYHQTPRPRSSP